jgi:Putative bacterial sensory transduction regulator
MTKTMTNTRRTHPPLTEAALSDLILNLTLDSLREILQQAGYRVETVIDPVAVIPYLRSATGGLAFDIRPGNRLAGQDLADQERGFADVAFTAVLQVQGELPLDLVNRWNATRRFARLQLSQPFLVFCMDVSAAGGVTPVHLRAHIEIWDRLVQELIAYLRDELQKLSAQAQASPRVAQDKTQASEPARDPAAEPNPSTTIQ